LGVLGRDRTFSAGWGSQTGGSAAGRNAVRRRRVGSHDRRRSSSGVLDGQGRPALQLHRPTTDRHRQIQNAAAQDLESNLSRADVHANGQAPQ